ncbi:MAG: TMEM165/GDT1 family protein, partial [Candidatus Brockarchaeota archaeon]|nr:TMEM165/GDT1 family protein [Candidatus Brockarchaeota archaeon]
IFLAAELKDPFMAMVGMMSAFLVVTTIGVAFGARLLGRLPEKHLRVGTAILFVLFGAAFLLEAIGK